MNVIYNNDDVITNSAIRERLYEFRDKFELIGLESDYEMRAFVAIDEETNWFKHNCWITPIPESFTTPEFNDGAVPSMWTCGHACSWSYVAFTLDGSDEIHHLLLVPVLEAFDDDGDSDPDTLDWTMREDRWVFMFTE